MVSYISSREQFFAKNYFQARQYFLELSNNLNAQLVHYLCPDKGPDEQDIYTDLAIIGNPNAKNIFIVVSGTHGVEGFCGSALQCQFMEGFDGQHASEDTAIMLIHGLNPYGFAWLRRVNEKNIDLNRNFMPFLEQLPNNQAYEAMHSTLCPKIWPGQFRRINDLKLLYFLRKFGEDGFQEAITQGQYDFSKGLFYGGTELSWSAKIFATILKGWINNNQKILFVDIHTGLGNSGEYEIISSYHPLQKEYKACKAFFKNENLAFSEDGNSLSASLNGVIEEGLHGILPENEINAVTLEFGTYDKEKIFEALRAENWLTAFGDLDNQEGKDIKANFQEMFYPNDAKWKTSIAQNGQNFLYDALERLK